MSLLRLCISILLATVVVGQNPGETVRTEVRNGVTITTRTTSGEARALAQPIAELCDLSRRPMTTRFENQRYYFSWVHQPDRKFDWLGGRNFCRERCMDLITIDSKFESFVIKHFINRDKIKYIWTGGRLCDFSDSCNRPDLQPRNINGWYWVMTGLSMPPTNVKNDSDPRPNEWSHTGKLGTPQPDNRAKKEGVGVNESCMSVMNNIYQDGITWHDVACHHKKYIICEDSPRLLNFIQATTGTKTLEEPLNNPQQNN